MSIITLMTDFGLKDGNIGVLKGVIWGICPQVQIADITHLVMPQNIPDAALLLARSAPYFPKGTIHVVVVDPGVGTKRRPMAAALGDWFYVGPDNGTITMLMDRTKSEGLSCRFVLLDKGEYWLPKVSHVFHGRDIFSPVAAHLARGVPLSEVGTDFSDPVQLRLPKPVKTQKGWRGEIIYVDHFGNAASNILEEDLKHALEWKEKIVVHLKNIEMIGLVNTFGDRSPGEVVALFGSTGNLIVSVVNGNAATLFGLKVGDTIEVSTLALDGIP